MTLLKTRYTNAQQAREETFNTLSHQENAHSNQLSLTPQEEKTTWRAGGAAGTCILLVSSCEGGECCPTSDNLAAGLTKLNLC